MALRNSAPTTCRTAGALASSVGDFARHNVLLALKRNGLYMPIRDKGPLFIVYPYDSDPQLRHQRFYSRSAWQLVRIVVR